MGSRRGDERRKQGISQGRDTVEMGKLFADENDSKGARSVISNSRATMFLFRPAFGKQQQTTLVPVSCINRTL